MASLIKNLVNKQCSTRFMTTLAPQLLANNHQSIFSQGFTINPGNNPQFFGPKEEKEEEDYGGKTLLSDLRIYPSFSIGYFLNPILPSGSELNQVVRPVLGEMEHPDPGTMWADSVKKKRKKKMNKHKYKKLLKRLRRKTKT